MAKHVSRGERRFLQGLAVIAKKLSVARCQNVTKVAGHGMFTAARIRLLNGRTRSTEPVNATAWNAG